MVNERLMNVKWWERGYSWWLLIRWFMEVQNQNGLILVNYCFNRDWWSWNDDSAHFRGSHWLSLGVEWQEIIQYHEPRLCWRLWFDYSQAIHDRTYLVGGSNHFYPWEGWNRHLSNVEMTNRSLDDHKHGWNETADAGRMQQKPRNGSGLRSDSPHIAM